MSRPRTPVGWKGLSSVALMDAGITRSGGLIRVPYRLADGSVYANRVVAPLGRRWWEPVGITVIPFGLERVPSHASDAIVIVTEGESDALMVRDQLTELDGVSVCALGVPGAGTWRSEWARIFEQFAEIYIAGDGDPAGRGFCDRVLRDAPQARCLHLPDGEDLRSLVAAGGVDALVDLIDDADRIAAVYDRMITAPTLADCRAANIAEGRTAA